MSTVPCRPYVELVAALSESAAKAKGGADMLAQAKESLQAVLSYINGDPALAAAVLPGPLTVLHTALHDAMQGAKPALFKPDRSGAVDKPTNVMRDHMRGHVAAALDLLIRYGGMRVGDAAVWLADQSRQTGLRDEDNCPLMPKQIIAWRNKINANNR